MPAIAMMSEHVRANGRPDGGSRWRRHWVAALVVSALVHGLCLWLALVWAGRTVLQEAPAETSFDVVFEAPAPGSVSEMPQPPATRPPPERSSPEQPSVPQPEAQPAPVPPPQPPT